MGIMYMGLCTSCKVQKQDDAAQAAPPADVEASAAVPDVEPAPPAAAGESTWLRDYFGGELVKADGSKVGADTLAGKTVGVYFSAHWCPPCRRFTPVLVKTYNELKAAGKPFEIVFASSDKSEEAMFGYMKDTSMPWLALPFGSDHKGTLGKKYSVRGIPTLVILDEKGDTVTTGGRGDVSSKGADAFAGW